jgi:hypothetical protein
MKGAARYLVGAVVLALMGAVCLAASRFDGRTARVQHAMLTSDYEAADAALQALGRGSAYANRVPWLGERIADDLRARQAALAYWQRDYAALAPADRTDPVADVAPGQVRLQLIVADAVYREGQLRAKDRVTTLQVLESAINAYRAVLDNARRPEDAPYAEEAAYNYEYAIRLRDELLKGRRRGLPPPEDVGNFGQEGESDDPDFDSEFKLYVPLEKEERENTQPGQAAPPARKG